MNTLSSLSTGRVHLTDTEPHATRCTWTSLPRCLPDATAAVELQTAITALARPDARARRTWTITRCTCGVQS